MNCTFIVDVRKSESAQFENIFEAMQKIVIKKIA
jgi:hypothetical protein